MEWKKGITLGPKQKEFKWIYCIDKGLDIRRVFNNGEYTTTFGNDDLDKIMNYIKQIHKVTLANNVEKLVNGTEKDGLGKFIYNTISKNTTDAQAASQLVAILYEVGVLSYNGAKRGMEFWIINDNWQQRFLKYCKNTVSK